MSDVLDHTTAAESAAALVPVEAPADAAPPSTDLTIQAPAQTFQVSGGVLAVLAKIETEARARVAGLDASTEKGRKQIASVAYKVAQSKTALDTAGKNLTQEWHQSINRVNEDRRLLRERLDALKEEIRRPVTAFEEREKARIAAHEAALADLAALAETTGLTAEQISARLWNLPYPDERDWQEFAPRAGACLVTVQAKLEAAHEAALQHEAEIAEREAQARQEAARQAAEMERIRAEREAEIARQAAEAARLEAEAKAERDRQEAARKLHAAEQRALQAQRDAEAAIAHAQAKAEAERQRQQAEADQRAANLEHRAQINRAAAAAIAAAVKPLAPEFAEAIGRAVVHAIAVRQIPAVSIQY